MNEMQQTDNNRENNERKNNIENDDENKEMKGCDNMTPPKEKADVIANENEPLENRQFMEGETGEEDEDLGRNISKYIITSLSEGDTENENDTLEEDVSKFVGPSQTTREQMEQIDVELKEESDQEVLFSDNEVDDRDFEVIKSELSNVESEETPSLLLIQQDDNTNMKESLKSTDSELERKTEDFNIKLDLENYPPESISVSRRDNSLVVKAERKGERDGMAVSEQYVTEYSLPRDVNVDKMSCVKTTDGNIVVTAPYNL